MSRKTILSHTKGIAGVDEAGRGPLAGPVVAAAVDLPEDFDFSILDDSKKLSASQRESAELMIKQRANFSVVAISWEDIDRLNIFNATLTAMQFALERIGGDVKGAIVDGNRVPPLAPIACCAIVKADATYAAVAAASILAKVERDRIMTSYAAEFPEYGFDRHFGYPTPEHLANLKKHGPCAIHRKSFEPVRSMIQQPCLMLVE